MTDWSKLYREAVEREGDIRDLAFLGQPEAISGLEVRPLTSRHVLWLQLARSPFLTNGQVEFELVPATIEQFLRIVITDSIHAPADDKRIDKLLADKVRSNGLVELVMGIKEYLDEAFIDAPTGKPGRLYYSRVAPIASFLCETTGQNIEQALSTPLKVAFQLMKVHRQKNIPKCILFNPSDNITSRWLASETN
jgi:hypothetical protein